MPVFKSYAKRKQGVPVNHVILFDGTWCDREDQTNISKMLDLCAVGNRQSVFYDPGVGSKFGNRLRGGIFGRGAAENVQQAIAYLVEHWRHKDSIMVFGFSRGAFEARTLCGCLNHSGLPLHAEWIPNAWKAYKRKKKPAYKDKVNIRFAGCFDTVRQTGIKHKFGDIYASDNVLKALHICAIDERRKAFPLTHWEGSQTEQVFVPGHHADIGGGNDNSPRSDIAFNYMLRNAEACGLILNPDWRQRIFPDLKSGIKAPAKAWGILGYRKRIVPPGQFLFG